VNPLDIATLVLRLTAGATFVVQGFVKLARPPDAPHGRANLAAMVARRGLPRPAETAVFVAAIELLFGLLVLIGLFTRIATIPLDGVLIAAIVGFKFQAGFIGGWDWPLSVLAILVAIALLGPGGYSMDAILVW
jgi:putative oxidoreductase